MEEKASHIDRVIARARWARLARSGPMETDPLSVEVAQRHADTLAVVNIPTGPVLDVGCGIGVIPLAGVPNPVRLDLVAWPQQAVPQLIGDATNLPLANESFAFVWSNLCLPWLADPAAFFTEARRVLQEGGLLSVSSLGPDTLGAIDARARGLSPRTLGFLDMHDLADMAMNAGFAEPVAVRENLTFAYSDPVSMLTELRSFGALAAADMQVHLGQKRAVQALAAGNEPVELEFEVIYLHAWALPRRRTKVENTWQEVRFQS